MRWPRYDDAKDQGCESEQEQAGEEQLRSWKVGDVRPEAEVLGYDDQGGPA